MCRGEVRRAARTARQVQFQSAAARLETLEDQLANRN